MGGVEGGERNRKRIRKGEVSDGIQDFYGFRILSKERNTGKFGFSSA